MGRTQVGACCSAAPACALHPQHAAQAPHLVLLAPPHSCHERRLELRTRPLEEPVRDVSLHRRGQQHLRVCARQTQSCMLRSGSTQGLYTDWTTVKRWTRAASACSPV